MPFTATVLFVIVGLHSPCRFCYMSIIFKNLKGSCKFPFFKWNTALMKLWLRQIEWAKLVTWEESCFGVLLGAVFKLLNKICVILVIRFSDLYLKVGMKSNSHSAWNKIRTLYFLNASHWICCNWFNHVCLIWLWHFD